MYTTLLHYLLNAFLRLRVCAFLGFLLIPISLCQGSWFDSQPAEGGRTLRFELEDSAGRVVRSADYAGVPLFLEFGACW